MTNLDFEEQEIELIIKETKKFMKENGYVVSTGEFYKLKF